MNKSLLKVFSLITILALMLAALPMQSAQAASTTVVISEFRTRGPNGGNDEFIELYNLSSSPINIGGWKIKGSNNAGGGTTTPRATIPANTFLNSGCRYLLTNSTSPAYSGSVPGNQTYGTGITDDGGIAVTTVADVIVDQVGMSTGSAFKEGTVLAPLTTNVNRGYERKSGGTQDTDNNANDFVLRTPSDPQNSVPCQPKGVGAATPSSVRIGQTTLLTVSVTPATTPPSTGIAVTGDLTSLGGSASQPFFDDGTNGDATAGDLVFSFLATVSVGTPTGLKAMNTTITDAQSRMVMASIAVTVTTNASITVTCGGPLITEAGTPASTTVMATDPDGVVVSIAINGISPSPAPGSIFVTNLQPASTLGGTASADINVDANVPAGTYAVGVTATNNDGMPQTGTCTLTVQAVLITPIHDIQDASHVSPFKGQSVTTKGVVTVKRSNGFYMQDPNLDGDDATSEGIFVFTSSAPTVNVGDFLRVTGNVSEFRPGGSSTANLTTTELASPSITVLSSGYPLPAPVVIGTGGRMPPTENIEDDATGDVETSGVFDPATDGIDFYESMEGMLVQVNNPLAVGPTNQFGETPVVPDNGAWAGVRTPRGGVLLRPNDGNPERLVLDDLLVPIPPMNVGDYLNGAVVGALDYNFGNFFLEVTTNPAPPLVSGGLAQEVTTPAGTNQLAVATFNVENLDPGDSSFGTLAGLIVNNLQAPDVIAIEEIQDNNGETNDSIVDATTTWTTLINAIQTAGGPVYDFRQINPVDDQDGGAPGGNIRQGFLFRTDRGLSFLDHPGAGSTTANDVTGTGAGTQLLYSPGRIDPTNSAFNSSRKPLAAEFMYNGHHVFMIANHFNSKGGDQPLFGRFQPPTRSSEVQRHAQAQIVNDFVDKIIAADSNADVVVLGDLNDFQFSDTLTILKGGVLNTLMDTLPLSEQYSYDFDGNSQAIDHTLLSNHLFTTRPYQYDVVHVNSEFADQASDHEPQVTRITLNDPPTANAGGPYAVDEGSSVTLAATGSDPEGAALTYAWDLDDNGTFETPSQSISFTGVDGLSIPTVKVQVTDNGGLTAVASAVVTVNNVAPTATFGTPGSVDEGASFGISLTSPVDVPADLGSLQYAFDCGSGYGAFGSSNTVTCPTVDNGTLDVGGKVKDKDDGVSEYTGTVTVNNVPPSVAVPVVSPDPSTEGSSVTASATFTDPGVYDAPFTCTVNYGDGSGVLPGTVSGYTCTGPAHTYSTFGAYTVTISVTDKDSGTGSNTTQHLVIFNWMGFFQPVDNLPTLNVVKAGSAIPVKFSLGGNRGLNIFAAGYPVSQQIACDTGAPLDDIEQTVTAGSSSLSFDPLTNQYNYVWKTDKAWAGTCRQLTVKLVDGTSHYANFKFK